MDFQDVETPRQDDAPQMATRMSAESSNQKESSYFMNISTYLAAKFEKDKHSQSFYQQEPPRPFQSMVSGATLTLLKVLLIIGWLLLGPFVSVMIALYALVRHCLNSL
mmetsp:Transcript_13248/g.20702  ORF Transcript_13248/g.20702 Transcript_13248/m.20702 type:complete len:108 (-) Transcript_13248:257-580(-)